MWNSIIKNWKIELKRYMEIKLVLQKNGIIWKKCIAKTYRRKTMDTEWNIQSERVVENRR